MLSLTVSCQSPMPLLIRFVSNLRFVLIIKVLWLIKHLRVLMLLGIFMDRSDFRGRRKKNWKRSIEMVCCIWNKAKKQLCYAHISFYSDFVLLFNLNTLLIFPLLALAQESKCAAEELYRALPPTTFTRTISNPEVVMKKRREKKIAAKLKDLGQGKESVIVCI